MPDESLMKVHSKDRTAIPALYAIQSRERIAKRRARLSLVSAQRLSALCAIQYRSDAFFVGTGRAEYISSSVFSGIDAVIPIEFPFKVNCPAETIAASRAASEL